jgi:thiamine biosynthesis lipoprotein
MDTYINIKLYCNDNDKAKEALNYVDDLYNEYDKLADRYKKYDDIKNIYYVNNELAIDKQIKIDSKLYDILKYSKSYYYKTNGLFNIALGNVIDAWKNYRDGIKQGVPTYDELKNSGSIDINDLILLDDNTIIKKSNVSIDLGAITKGYVTEIAGDYLESIGIDKYLITAGSSSVKAGNHYNNGKYKIGLTDPSDPTSLYKVITGNNISVTTSGSYERYYEYNGKKYSHIIDPNTLFPSNNMLSVTVLSDDASLGEILSTTLFLMPIKDGLEYIKLYDGVEAIWYGMDNKVTLSPGMNAYE